MWWIVTYQSQCPYAVQSPISRFFASEEAALDCVLYLKTLATIKQDSIKIDVIKGSNI